MLGNAFRPEDCTPRVGQFRFEIHSGTTNVIDGRANAKSLVLRKYPTTHTKK